MIEIHLYGKLRRFARNADPRAESIVTVPHCRVDTVGSVVDRLSVPRSDLGRNLFVNGRYADLETPIVDGDRIGLFPDDMQLLYKWYFRPKEGR